MEEDLFSAAVGEGNNRNERRRAGESNNNVKEWRREWMKGATLKRGKSTEERIEGMSGEEKIMENKNEQLATEGEKMGSAQIC
jgi:hypothetical protein